MNMSRIACGLVLCASAAGAQEINLTVEGTGPQVTEFYRAASVVLSLDPETNPAPQDYIAAARAEYRAMLTAMYARGNYNGTVSVRIDGREAADLSPLEAPATIGTIDIRVDPAGRFAFGRTEIAPLAPGTELPPEFAPGQDAAADVIRQATAGAISGWRDVGHAKAEVTDQQIIARHPDRILDVAVQLAPGPRLTFGALDVTGNEAVRTSAIVRIAGLPTGEVFSPDEVERAARRLRDTGTFDSVALSEQDAIGPGNTLGIDAAVQESKPRRIGFGLELSSVEGLKVSGYWLHRNLFGGAERFQVGADVSGIGGTTGGIDYGIDTALTIPAIYGPDTDLTFTTALSRQDEPDYLLDSFATEVVATRKLSDDLEVSVGVGLLTARAETPLGTRRYTLFTVPLTATLDRRDNPTNAKDGYYIAASATPFLSLDGGANGAWFYGDARAYRSFGETGRIGIAARGQVGSVVGADQTNAPQQYLFFSGGSNTVRGQPYQSLGIDRVVDGETVTIGGLSYLGAQIEARYGVTDNIDIVGFYDVGFVGATETPGKAGDWNAGTGLGLRYNTGIGPIRLDIGTPANGDDAFERVEVYIGIGQAF